jgi:hypothetical protein
VTGIQMRGIGYANVLCDFHKLKENNILCSWNTIRVGKECNLFDNSQVVGYAVEYLVDNPHETNQFIVELACCDNTMSIGDALNKVADIFDKKIEHESVAWILEMRKLRFCILMYLKEHIFDKNELLDKIEQVCDDFSFLKDMKAFIGYMPAEDFDFLKCSKEERIERLIKLFEEFLINEKKFLIESR